MTIVIRIIMKKGEGNSPRPSGEDVGVSMAPKATHATTPENIAMNVGTQT